MKWSNLVFFLFPLLLWTCDSENELKIIQGEAQGTTYSIKYYGQQDLEDAIDSVLLVADQHFSTYLSSSMVSRINTEEIPVEVDAMFTDLWEKCWDLSIRTNGYFDPTLGPLLALYDFDVKSKKKVDSASIAGAHALTGMHLLSIRDGKAIKKVKGLKLDFNAVAQGYTVDLLADLLESKGYDHYMVELGGEVRAGGRKSKKSPWMIGIDRPMEGERQLIAKLALTNASLATSGNYRKFKEVNGELIGHILNPKTGTSVQTNILSVSVIHPKCYLADAMATAFMNMTLQEIAEIDADDLDLFVFIVYLEEGVMKTYQSPGLKAELIN